MNDDFMTILEALQTLALWMIAVQLAFIANKPNKN